MSTKLTAGLASQSTKDWMRKQATTVFELTKGFTPEQRNAFGNAMNTMEEMAGYVLELTNETSNPQTQAGPVWVKATTEMPVGKKDREKISVKYKGSPDVLIFLEGKWNWWDDLYDKRNPMIDKCYVVNPDSWAAIEWLKESPQQVFTREQVMEISERAHQHGWYHKEQEFDMWFNKNYPQK